MRAIDHSCGFGSLAVLLLVTTISGYVAIRRGRIDQHRRWMTRSYAMMLAAVTLRIELPLLICAASGSIGIITK